MADPELIYVERQRWEALNARVAELEGENALLQAGADARLGAMVLHANSVYAASGISRILCGGFICMPDGTPSLGLERRLKRCLGRVRSEDGTLIGSIRTEEMGK